ncbi:ABC transporter permease [Halobacteria archaeon AArc-curdl1]|uniref:ABC transporter permease n=1 Tax=Natronosalvus hydrolyticus TaxID=2979988 RepID=A0AAP2Z6E6_9EURY|nr:ABC transporter permease [Halobacteria archaeon AArc-curdl1]
MKRTEDDTAFDETSDGRDSEYTSRLLSDGGQTARMFDDTEVTEVTRTQQFAEVVDESIVQPTKIAWSDWRTKIGMIIISLFFFMGAVTSLHRHGYEWFNGALAAVGMPWQLGEPRAQQAPERFLRPFESWQYPLGTDMMGRDLLSGIFWATPQMIQMVIAAGVFVTVVATVIGTTAGYKRGNTETVLMTLTDIAMTIPGLPLVIVIVALIDTTNPFLLGIILSINAWAGLARSIHSQVLSLREHSYVEASRTMGVGTSGILRKDILPNLMPYIMINFTFAARGVIYASVALYFLGVLSYDGIGNWGVMMNMAYAVMGAFEVPGRMYLLLVPMAPVVIVSFGFILFSQGTDRLFNPRVRTRHEGATKSEAEDEDTIHGPVK